MLPLIEIRGAAIYASAQTMPLLPSLLVGLAGNMLPIPFIFYFARKLLIWGSDKVLVGPLFSFFLERGESAGKKLLTKAGRGLYFALFIFVAIPLPGTGAWTGILASSILDMDFKRSVLACLAGVFVAAVIVYLASSGILSLGGALFN